MARQAESERERRAKIINAEAEFQAAQKLVQAASMISAQPIALQLRFLQTMKEISNEHKTTTILPIPIYLRLDSNWHRNPYRYLVPVPLPGKLNEVARCSEART